MTQDEEFTEICKMGWGHDFNDDGEEYPNLYDKHGYSLGFNIDNQLTETKTAFIMYYFPDKYVVIDRIVDCGHGEEDKLFRGYIRNIDELKGIMIKFNIVRLG